MSERACVIDITNLDLISLAALRQVIMPYFGLDCVLALITIDRCIKLITNNQKPSEVISDSCQVFGLPEEVFVKYEILSSKMKTQAALLPKGRDGTDKQRSPQPEVEQPLPLLKRAREQVIQPLNNPTT